MTDLTFPGLVHALAEAFPEREVLVQGRRRYTWAEHIARIDRIASVLCDAGLGARRERPALQGWESGQDSVALVLRNGPEFIEIMLGAMTARAASFNVNYRYTAREMTDIFCDARPSAVVFHGAFADAVREAVATLDPVPMLLQVDDDTSAPLGDGAVSYEAALDGSRPEPPRTDWSPDDLYILYTGGTTGTPKGVLWRSEDALVACFALHRRDGSSFGSVEAVVDEVRRRAHSRVTLPAPPLIHGAGQWLAIGSLLAGGKVVLCASVKHFDPEEVLDLVASESVTDLMLVGDAFGRPIGDALAHNRRDLSSLRVVINGGAAMSPGTRHRILGSLPGTRFIDAVGSSESGRQLTREFGPAGDDAPLSALSGSVVLAEDRSRVLDGSDDEIGWLATGGRIPLGYLHDRVKTEATFPVVAGVRYSVPGDRARPRPGGTIELLGRDSVCINSGGEKIYGEEVEQAIVSHRAVVDAIVVGRPDPRWGQAVVAVVAVTAEVTAPELQQHVTSVLARYKSPKHIVFVDRVPRTVAGKPDHRAVHELLDARLAT